MEIWVDNASYPTPAIEKNSHDYRPLGLGYANLGALLMSRGLPYDSDEGRAYAAAITALMCGQAYTTSAKIAPTTGPFAGYERNREPFLQVMRKHQSHADGIDAGAGAVGPALRGARLLGRRGHPGHRVRLPQRPGDGAGADRHHRLHDGLRHHRDRARPGAGQVQEARRRRAVQDRQQHRAAGAQEAGLRARGDPDDRRLHQREQHGRGLRRAEGGAPADLRLLVQADQGQRARSTTWATSR